MRGLALTVVLGLIPGFCFGQADFNIAGRKVQMHSFFSQGFAYSDNNNFLAMKTSNGSAAMTDGSLNMATRLTDKLRIGAQMYIYNLGELGNFVPQLDWAVVDYRFRDYLGVRAGKVKTVLGLSTDTQDMNFLHTWALLPQSIYPWDLRSTSIAHKGLDLYGSLSLRGSGTLEYTVYAGLVGFDREGGSAFAVRQALDVKDHDQRTAGADLRWNTPLQGLTIGTSLNLTKQRYNSLLLLISPPVPHALRANPERVSSTYVDFQRGKWHFSGELRSNHELFLTRSVIYGPNENRADYSFYSWYGTAAYRVAKWLELGTYHSYYGFNPGIYGPPRNSETDHIRDQTVAARLDLNRFWTVKLEGHFMDGYGNPYSSRGFYPALNPTGMKRNTNLLVVRTGWSF